MNKLFWIVPLLLVCSSCTSIRWATVEKGQIVNEKRQPLNIVGSPRITCLDPKGNVVADGFFVRQTQEGNFIVDEFGKRYVLVINPVCRLGENEKPSN